MTRLRLNALRFFTALGLFVSGYLVWQHIAYVTGADAGGLCDFSAYFDCSAIEASGFSSVFGIPTGSFGMLYFAGFLAFLFAARPVQLDRSSKRRERKRGGPNTNAGNDVERIAAMVTVLGVAVSISFATLSALVIHAFCLGCTTVYFITLANVAIAWRGSPTQYLGRAMGGPAAAWRGGVALVPEAGSWDPNPNRTLALCFVFVFVPINFALPLLLEGRSAPLGEVYAQYLEESVEKFEIGPDALTKGDADAPLQIVAFVDFQCEACRKFSGHLTDEVLPRFRGKFRVVYKHFPLSKQCNPHPLIASAKDKHPNACGLALMAQALAGDKRLWDVVPGLYEAAHAADVDYALRQMAAQAGLDMAQWTAMAEDPAVEQAVQSNIREGIELGFGSLPIVYLNGRKMPSRKPPEMIAIMRNALNDAR